MNFYEVSLKPFVIPDGALGASSFAFSDFGPGDDVVVRPHNETVGGIEFCSLSRALRATVYKIVPNSRGTVDVIVVSNDQTCAGFHAFDSQYVRLDGAPRRRK